MHAVKIEKICKRNMLKLPIEVKCTMQLIQSNSEVRRVPNSLPIVEHPNLAFQTTYTECNEKTKK